MFIQSFDFGRSQRGRAEGTETGANKKSEPKLHCRDDPKVHSSNPCVLCGDSLCSFSETRRINENSVYSKSARKMRAIPNGRFRARRIWEMVQREWFDIFGFMAVSACAVLLLSNADFADKRMSEWSGGGANGTAHDVHRMMMVYDMWA